ncbi:MAG: hypothetical protein ABIH75_01615 [Candidatus Omnitrophota bacterium]
MPESKPITPEKQLLRLIEDNKEAAPGKKIEAKAIRHFSLSLFSFGGWLGRFSFFKNKLKEGWGGQERLSLVDIGVINNSLILCIFIFTAYFVFNFSFSLRDLNKLPGLDLKPQGAAGSSGLTEAPGLRQSVSYYLDKVINRDIFKMGPKNPLIAKGGPSEKAIEATQHLKLVGISWSNNPDAMIEDSKAMRTFFLKRGQMIGDVKVEAIFKDKVILNYSGEDIELK